MNRIKVLIIEDELIIAEKIKKILSDIGYEVVGIGMSYEEGSELFSAHNPDVVIADINLNGAKDGVDLIQDLRPKSNFKAIFVTSYSDQKTVERVKNAKPDAYLVKPFGKEDLYTTIETVMVKESESNAFSHDSNNHIYVKSKNAIIKIDLDKIIAVRSEDIYCVFMMKDGQEHLVRNSMKQLLAKLGTDFLRIHKSYIIRFKMIEKMEYDGITIGEYKFPIGRTYREELMQRLDVL